MEPEPPEAEFFARSQSRSGLLNLGLPEPLKKLVQKNWRLRNTGISEEPIKI